MLYYFISCHIILYYIVYFLYVGPNLITIESVTVFLYIGVRAGARTGYVIPGRDGNGGWRFEEILPPSSSPPSTPKIEFLVKSCSFVL